MEGEAIILIIVAFIMAGACLVILAILYVLSIWLDRFLKAKGI